MNNIFLLAIIGFSILLLLISIFSNVYGIIVNNTDFSIEVPNGWVYREDLFTDNGILLTPNEFGDILISDNDSILLDVLKDKVLVQIASDSNFPIKNAPVEMYVKVTHQDENIFSPRYENTTIGGEKAIKVYYNTTGIVNALEALDEANVIDSPLVVTSYNAMHDDKPYFLVYTSGAKNYQKYLPQFEQMAKTFKFVK
jgi:hypothetical protein